MRPQGPRLRPTMYVGTSRGATPCHPLRFGGSVGLDGWRCGAVIPPCPANPGGAPHRHAATRAAATADYVGHRAVYELPPLRFGGSVGLPGWRCSAVIPPRPAPPGGAPHRHAATRAAATAD